ncbi:MAG TPA: hypothetical protein VI749_05165 [Candidatus Omnitrophota bacterium]|nr:hypothetical protein [Candidatus Omnitrophota bacterium]
MEKGEVDPAKRHLAGLLTAFAAGSLGEITWHLLFLEHPQNGAYHPSFYLLSFIFYLFRFIIKKQRQILGGRRIAEQQQAR